MSLHTNESVYRERLLEHLLIGELLKHSWLHHGAELEVSQPAIDRSGHDVVLEANGITRHVQLKASAAGASTSVQKVHLGLANKPSGCVIWMRFDSTSMSLGPFLLFAGQPGEPLPSVEGFKVARHTKGNAEGVKKERPNLRIVPISKFRSITGIAQLYDALFASGTGTAQAIC